VRARNIFTFVLPLRLGFFETVNMSSEQEHELLFNNMFEKLKSMFDSKLEEVKGEIRSSGSELRNIVETMNSALVQVQSKCEVLEKENNRLTSEVVRLENYSRRNNLIFFNIREENNEVWEKTEHNIAEFIESVMKVKLGGYDIERAHRLGKKGRNARPIIVKFNSWKKKMEILGAVHTLRGIPIGVSEDFAESTRRTREELKACLSQARSMGMKAFLKLDKLVVDGKIYSKEEWEQNKSLQTIRSPSRVHTGVVSKQRYISEKNWTPTRPTTAEDGNKDDNFESASPSTGEASDRPAAAAAAVSGVAPAAPGVAAKKPMELEKWLTRGTVTRSRVKKAQNMTANSSQNA
jgi:hypothetical protein